MFEGVVYKIIGTCGKIYIGSTIHYKKRKEQHIYCCSHSSSGKLQKPLKFIIIRKDQYKLMRTLLLVEQFYIDNHNCVNEKRAFIKFKYKKFYKKNRDKILKKANDKYHCILSKKIHCKFCNSLITKGNMLRHTKTNKKCKKIQATLF